LSETKQLNYDQKNSTLNRHSFREEFPIENGVEPRANWKAILEDVSLRNIGEVILQRDIGETEASRCFFDSFKNYKSTIKSLPADKRPLFQIVLLGRRIILI